jgi:hypothetical protein
VTLVIPAIKGEADENKSRVKEISQ